MTTLCVSTPRFTCRVVVDGRNLIARGTAPYLRREVGTPWRLLHARLQRQWGRALRVVEVAHEEEATPAQGTLR